MIRQLSAGICLALVTAAIPLRAANRPHAGTDSQNPVVWTNDDLKKLHRPGLISIVGPMDEEQPAPASVPEPYEETSGPESSPAPFVETRDAEWYAEQAARLRDELEHRQAELYQYEQAIDKARSLKESTGGINLVGEDFAITPEDGIEILQQRVEEVQERLGDLEDLARRNDIEPGTLRGR